MLANRYRFTSFRRSNILQIPKILNRSVSSDLNHHFSHKNAVLLTNLPTNITSENLLEKLKDLKKKEVHLQPGCALHFIEQADAEKSLKILAQKNKKLKFSTRKVGLPTVLLQNLPSSVGPSDLAQLTKENNLVFTKFNSGKTYKLNLKDESKTQALFSSLKEAYPSIQCSIARNIEGAQFLVIENVSASVWDEINKQFNFKEVGEINAGCATGKIRLSNVRDPVPLQELVDMARVPHSVAFGKLEPIGIPTLFVRNFADDLSLIDLFASFKPLKYHFLRESVDSYAQLALFQFKSEQDALLALRALKQSNTESAKLSISYKEIFEQCIRIDGLPNDISESEIRNLFGKLPVARIDIHAGKEFSKAIVIPNNSDEIFYYYQVASHQTLRDLPLHSSEEGSSKNVCTIKMDKNSHFGLDVFCAGPEEFSAAASAFKASPASRLTAGVDVAIGVETLMKANQILSNFLKGNALDYVTPAKITSTHTVALEIEGLDIHTPVAKLISEIQSEWPAVNVWKAERNALVRFRSAKNIVPGIKFLKKLNSDTGLGFKIDRYKPLARRTESAYDQSDSLKFDFETREILFKDGLRSDPAGRYQVLYNEFERRLHDAILQVADRFETEDEDFEQNREKEIPTDVENDEGADDIELFIDDSLPASVREEAESLIARIAIDPTEHAEEKDRLFEIFVQQKKFRHLSRDFNLLETLHGPARNGDPLNWATLRVEGDNDMQRVYTSLSNGYEKYGSPLVYGADEISFDAVDDRNSSDSSKEAQELRALLLEDELDDHENENEIEDLDGKDDYEKNGRDVDGSINDKEMKELLDEEDERMYAVPDSDKTYLPSDEEPFQYFDPHFKVEEGTSDDEISELEAKFYRKLSQALADGTITTDQLSSLTHSTNENFQSELDNFSSEIMQSSNGENADLSTDLLQGMDLLLQSPSQLQALRKVIKKLQFSERMARDKMSRADKFDVSEDIANKMAEELGVSERKELRKSFYDTQNKLLEELKEKDSLFHLFSDPQFADALTADGDDEFSSSALNRELQSLLQSDSGLMKDLKELISEDDNNETTPSSLIDELRALQSDSRFMDALKAAKIQDSEIFKALGNDYSQSVTSGESEESELAALPENVDLESEVASLMKTFEESIASEDKAEDEKENNMANISDEFADGELSDMSENTAETEKESLTEAEQIFDVIDSDGRAWAGVVIDTDMVQRTLPGGRMGSYRALVVVGNARGSAGYGVGKAQIPSQAVNTAARAALRNLTHVDLYDNFGLAHDLVGKHNSCLAYIKSTPQTRAMIASDFSEQILHLFGIGSASIKLVGRRDPYAKVLAIFDAMKKHQNIDEYAKARGKRYLSEKWLHEQGAK